MAPSGIPMICNGCSKVFPSYDIAGTGTVEIREGAKLATTCPFCGEEATAPEGTYKLFNDSVEFIARQPAEQLRLLKAIVESAQQKGDSPEAVTKQIEESVPGMKKYMPNNATELALYLSFLLPFLKLLLPFIQLLGDRSEQSITVEQINIYKNKAVQQYYEDISHDSPANIPSFDPLRAPGESEGITKVRRNDPCPCGSGKKYKRCCEKGS